MYDIEKIVTVKTLEDASRALLADKDAVVIAGGSDILIKIRSGKLSGCRLVSIRDIKELHGVALEQDGTICIRPLTTFSEITRNPIIRELVPVLAYAVDQVGSPQIRNVGTIGGNISNGVTSADSASTLFALNAEIEITGYNTDSHTLCVRNVPIQQYYLGAGKVCLKAGELCTAIRIHKKDYDGYCGYYFKYGKRNAMEIATLGCSVVAKISDSASASKIEDIRISFGVAGPVPMRCVCTEKAVCKMAIDDTLYDKLADKVVEEINPRDSWRASRGFRLHLSKVVSVRSLRALIHNRNEGKKGGSNALVGVL